MFFFSLCPSLSPSLSQFLFCLFLLVYFYCKPQTFVFFKFSFHSRIGRWRLLPFQRFNFASDSISAFISRRSESGTDFPVATITKVKNAIANNHLGLIKEINLSISVLIGRIANLRQRLDIKIWETITRSHSELLRFQPLLKKERNCDSMELDDFVAVNWTISESERVERIKTKRNKTK